MTSEEAKAVENWIWQMIQLSEQMRIPRPPYELLVKLLKNVRPSSAR